MPDLTQWLTDEFLEDHLAKPITIKVSDLSKKFNITVTIKVTRKEEG